MSELSDIHNVGYETGYREGYEAGKKEILDAFFPEDVKKELIQFLKENLSEKKYD